MTLEFKVESPDGATSVTSNDIASAFQEQGFKQATLSPDGQTVHLVDANGGTGEISIPDFLGAKSKILSVAPIQGLVDDSTVDAGLRSNIAALGNHNDLKQLYLKAQLREKGLENVNVVGTGDDFYYFDPNTGKYHALTNKPGFEWSDVRGFVPKAAETALSMGGSIAGGILGVGTGAATGTGLAGPGVGTIGGGIVGGAIGSATGGAMGRHVFDSAAVALNPDLAPYIYSEEMQNQRLQEAGIDAITGGIGGVIPAAIMKKGLASTALAKGAGAVEKTADIVGKGAGYLASDAFIPKAARAVAENFVPVTGQLQLPALVARAGELLPSGLKAGNKLGNWAYGKFANPANLAEETMLQGYGRRLADWTAKKGLTKQKAPEWGERIAASVEGRMAPTPGIAEAGIKQTLENMTANTRFSGMAPGVGDALELASKGGRAVDAVNSFAVRAPIRGVELGAKEVALMSNVAKNAARAATPLENQVLLRQGGNWASEESSDWWNRGRKTSRPELGK